LFRPSGKSFRATSTNSRSYYHPILRRDQVARSSRAQGVAPNQETRFARRPLDRTTRIGAIGILGALQTRPKRTEPITVTLKVVGHTLKVVGYTFKLVGYTFKLVAYTFKVVGHTTKRIAD
jgi:hypothetical protein